MCDNKTPLHYVCTWDEASQLINSHDSFWVCDCGCRERKEGGCHRSRHDVCLMFTHDNAASGSNKHQLTRAEAEAIMVEARTKYLVTRPFRDESTRTVTEGICFCCDDCCGYFLDPTEVCDKGQFIEQTDMEACTQCGECDLFAGSTPERCPTVSCRCSATPATAAGYAPRFARSIVSRWSCAAEHPL
jgi:hypothetical protein